jgi:alkylation response protein AidB-like acyl-CoA dehydrogenase
VAGPTIPEVHAEVARVSADFAADGQARRERRQLDSADFARLADAGLHLTGVPRARGGLWESPAVSVREYCSLYRTLAHGDSSVALVGTMHPTVIAFWLHGQDAPQPDAQQWGEQLEQVITHVSSGKWFGTIASEPGANGDLLASRAVARHVGPDNHWLMSGDKFMGSGSGVTSFMLTVAKPDGADVPDVFLIDTRQQPWDGSTGVLLVREWDGIGMAATQSHAFRFDEMAVARYAWPDHALTLAPTILPFINAMFAAVALGILDNAMAVARSVLHKRGERTKALEKTLWVQAENQYWLAEQALAGMITAVERADDAVWASGHGKLAIAELGESVMHALERAVGGQAFSRSAPFAQWGADIRALGYLRPPWPLAYDQLYAQAAERLA